MIKKQPPIRLTAAPHDRPPMISDEDERIERVNREYMARVHDVIDRGGVWGAVQPYGLGQRGHR